MKLLTLCAAALLCAGCANGVVMTDAKLLRIKGDAYMEGWRDAVKQGATDI